MSEAKDNFNFRLGGGEMGALIRKYDWNNSTLEGSETCPNALEWACPLPGRS